MRQAESLATSYAAQLQHVADQMNQMTLSIAHAWQDAPKTIHLEQDQERGIYPNRYGFAISITDHAGRPVQASFRLEDIGNVSEQSFFTSHKNDCCLGMLITGGKHGQLPGRSIVQFSRRINHADGSFAGFVVISVTPEFMTSFQNEALPSNVDFISARLVGGQVLATRMGSGALDQLMVYSLDPGFYQTRGVIHETAQQFVDRRARYVAW